MLGREENLATLMGISEAQFQTGTDAAWHIYIYIYGGEGRRRSLEETWETASHGVHAGHCAGAKLESGFEITSLITPPATLHKGLIQN